MAPPVSELAWLAFVFVAAVVVVLLFEQWAVDRFHRRRVLRKARRLGQVKEPPT